MKKIPAWTCPVCDTEYNPGFPWELDMCEACEQEGASYDEDHH